MRRTKHWWSGLTTGERRELHWLEFHASKYNARGSAGLPDDCSECRVCNTPHPGFGLCPVCNQRLDKIINKADQAMLASTAPKGGWLEKGD